MHWEQSRIKALTRQYFTINCHPTGTCEKARPVNIRMYLKLLNAEKNPGYDFSVVTRPGLDCSVVTRPGLAWEFPRHQAMLPYYQH